MSGPGDPLATALLPAFSHPRVGARMSTRAGGVGRAPFDSFNLRPGIGDDEAAVAANRAHWAEQVGVPLCRVDQVHGAAVVEWPAALAQGQAEDAELPVADASFTRAAGLACEIQVADCLPVLLADRHGRCVGAAHAGWRGLAGGVLDATVAAITHGGDVRAEDLETWLGPCIGPTAFEVGDEVREAFLRHAPDADRVAGRFRPGQAAGKWWADLAGLARDRLGILGVGRVSGNDSSPAWCTYSQPSRFFSFRRDRVTGRLAAAIWLRAD